MAGAGKAEKRTKVVKKGWAHAPTDADTSVASLSSARVNAGGASGPLVETPSEDIGAVKQKPQAKQEQEQEEQDEEDEEQAQVAKKTLKRRKTFKPGPHEVIEGMAQLEELRAWMSAKLEELHGREGSTLQEKPYQSQFTGKALAHISAKLI